MQQELLSVGIDLGTTTSQVIFSRLTIESTAMTAVPEVKIKDKQIIYRSRIHFTPLVQEDVIDVAALKEIIENEYCQAGIAKADIATGAIIITGETARKANAEAAVQGLSDFAGDFVVAAAGPDLESVLAGYGAGAAELSEQLPEKVINFDIGGGTTNAAVFDGGDVADSFALDIGGRLIRLSSANKITYISEKIKPLLAELGLELAVGQMAEYNQLKRLTDSFADILLKLSQHEELSPAGQRLFIGHADKGQKLSRVIFSGGVAEYVYSSEAIDCLTAVNKFGDIGPLLGWSIRQKLQSGAVQLCAASEKIRATVIGAGSYSVHISGSTVISNDACVPLKSVPVIHVQDYHNLREEIMVKRRIYEADEQTAIAFKGVKAPSYQELKQLAADITSALKDDKSILLVIVENDFAKALGMLLQQAAPTKQVICIDRIKAGQGDYVDIGRTVAGVVPVVVKTLIFKAAD